MFPPAKGQEHRNLWHDSVRYEIFYFLRLQFGFEWELLINRHRLRYESYWFWSAGGRNASPFLIKSSVFTVCFHSYWCLSSAFASVWLQSQRFECKTQIWSAEFNVTWGNAGSQSESPLLVVLLKLTEALRVWTRTEVRLSVTSGGWEGTDWTL